MEMAPEDAYRMVPVVVCARTRAGPAYVPAVSVVVARPVALVVPVEVRLPTVEPRYAPVGPMRLKLIF